MGARPNAVEVWTRPWVCCQGPWGRDQDCGGTARGRGGAVKTVGVQPGAVGVQLMPWGRIQDRGGTAKGRGGPPGAVGVWSRLWGGRLGAVGVWLRP